MIQTKYKVKHIIGKKIQYDIDLHKNYIYFCEDTNQIILNNIAYGIDLKDEDLEIISDVILENRVLKIVYSNGKTKSYNLPTVKTDSTLTGSGTETDPLSVGPHRHNISDINKLEDRLQEIVDSKVTKVTGKEAIKVTEGLEPEVSLKLPSNNILSQTDAGLTATLGLSYLNGVISLTGISGKVIKSVDLGLHQLIESGTLISKDGKLYIVLKFSGVEDTIEIDVTKLIDIYTGSNGINVTDLNKIELVINPDSTDYIKLTTDGISILPLYKLIESKSPSDHTHFSDNKTIEGNGSSTNPFKVMDSFRKEIIDEAKSKWYIID